MIPARRPAGGAPRGSTRGKPSASAVGEASLGTGPATTGRPGPGQALQDADEGQGPCWRRLSRAEWEPGPAPPPGGLERRGQRTERGGPGGRAAGPAAPPRRRPAGEVPASASASRGGRGPRPPGPPLGPASQASGVTGPSAARPAGSTPTPLPPGQPARSPTLPARRPVEPAARPSQAARRFERCSRRSSSATR